MSNNASNAATITIYQFDSIQFQLIDHISSYRKPGRLLMQKTSIRLVAVFDE
jgi:hypothetical protein